MMDAKITKLRLSRMLSYDWLKIIMTAAALIVVWMLIFSSTATRITAAQKFGVCNYYGNEAFSLDFSTSYANAHSSGIFSSEVIELTSPDMPASGDAAAEVLPARLTVGEVDAMLVSQQDDLRTVYTEEVTDPLTGEKKTVKKYRNSYLESFVANYRYSLHDLSLDGEKSFFKQLENYLNKYYVDGYENENSLDKEKVEEDFLARIQRTKDKRYKKPAEIEKGLNESIDRIQKYRKALVSFYDYLDEGVVTLTKTTHEGQDKYDYSFEGVYSINLCPSTDSQARMSALAPIVGYKIPYVSDEETGETKEMLTAKDMNICLFDLNGEEEEFRYEGLLYVVYLIDTCVAK
jgi:hypothetical protein